MVALGPDEPVGTLDEDAVAVPGVPVGSPVGVAVALLHAAAVTSARPRIAVRIDRERSCMCGPGFEVLETWLGRVRPSVAASMGPTFQAVKPHRSAPEAHLPINFRGTAPRR